MAKTKKFFSLLNEIIEATTEDELTKICYRPDGVDMSYQRDELTWEQLETLFNLVGKLEGAYKPIEKAEEEPEQQGEEPEPEEEPNEDQQTTFEIYDEVIAHAETLEEARNLEEIVDYNNRIGLLTDTQRAALIGACLYMEQQLKAGKKPEDIPHRRK